MAEPSPDARTATPASSGRVRMTDPVQAEQFYRYSVKCDRAFAARLEEAARRAGVSVNAFVQLHFERILEEPARSDLPAARPLPLAELQALARRNRISLSAAKLFVWMRGAADANGQLRVAHAEAVRLADISSNAPGELFSDLREAVLIETVERATSARSGLYQVLGER